ncbi:Cilia- and flagella-associated protein 47, partial [Nowakowskiella sp. JEL0078]
DILVKSEKLSHFTPISTNENSRLQIRIKARIVEHKLRLKTLDGVRDIDLQNIHFGNIYFSQTVLLPAKLENRGPTPVQWVITHWGFSVPQIPLNRKNNEINTNEDVNNRGSITVQPSEGVIPPYQSMELKFTFAPKLIEPPRGFKKNKEITPQNCFKVPMQLKIINSSSKSSSIPGEEPINLLLTGEASPIQAKLSRKEILFQPILQGNITKEFIELYNNSKFLPFKFSFNKLAHFQLTPNFGILQPEQSIKIAVDFAPRQLGEFLFRSECSILAFNKPFIEE